MSNDKYIQELIERDKPHPIGLYYFVSEELKDDPPLLECGVCGKFIARHDKFCPKCGCRIDHDNCKIGAQR